MAIDPRTGRELPKGIIFHQNKYLGRFQYEGVPYSVSHEDLAKLELLFDDLKYEVRHGIYKKPTKLLFKDWFATWIETHRTQDGKKLRSKTKAQYLNCYKMYITESFKKKRLSKITDKDVFNLFEEMAENEYAYNTIRMFRNMLSGVFTDAIEEKIISENPVHTAKIPLSPSDDEQRVLDVDEAILFLKFAEPTELYYLFVTALETGMRCGELRALQWSNIDFKNRIIHVKHTMGYENKHYVFGPPKTDSSRRKIYMTNKVYNFLQEWKKIQQSMISAPTVKWKPDKGFENLVFTMKSGRPLSQTKVRDEIDNIVAAINKYGFEMEHINPHAFRHTFATRCLESGISPKVLQKLLGHKKLETTMDTYAHVLERLAKREIDKLDGWDGQPEVINEMAEIINIFDRQAI